MKIKAAVSLGALLLAGPMLVSCTPATPSEVGVESAPEVNGAAAIYTQDLLTQLQRWQQAKPADKGRERQLLLTKAEERRQLLAALAKTQPGEVLRVAFPASKRAVLPADLRALLEEPRELDGELEIVHVDDFDDASRSRFEQSLTTASGERVRLHDADGSSRELRTGQRVRLHGLRIPPAAGANPSDAGDLVVGGFDESILTLGADSSASYGSVPGVQPNTVGEQRTLVMMVNFQDAPSNKPWTSADMQALFTNQINPFYQEVSYGQTWFKPTVFGWQTIATNSTSCDRTAITNLADQAATAAGHVLTNYDRLVYAFPVSSTCGWGGLGSVGGKPSRAWFNGSFTKSAYTHELGHNLGLYHSHDLVCSGATLGSSCTVREYGDLADTMGAGHGHFNAYEKDRLGWFGSRILTVTSSGSYRLAPQEYPASLPLALKTLRSVDPTSGAKTWYYVEYRQAVGEDRDLSFYATYGGNLHKGVSIHRGVDLNGNTSHLLDTTPTTSAWYDAALETGKVFSDSEANISVSTQSTSSSEAQVTVSLGTQPCTQNPPTVSLTASSDNWVSAGSGVSYRLTVGNQDSSTCTSRSFALSASAPAGWTSSLSTSAVSLAPGASATATLSITSPTSAAAGFYDILATAVSGSHNATASALYVIEAPVSNQPPIANNDQISLASIAPVVIPVLSNDSDPQGAPLEVISVTQGTKGTVAINANGTVTYSPARNFKNNDSFTYTISNGSLTASANVQISLTQSGGGSGKGGNN